jgi:hypothetical protein
MRHLQLRVYPESDLEISAEFIQTIATFFANAHGTQLKSAYAETLTSLLHSVIDTATAEVNHPSWSKAVALILQRGLNMASKPRYWPVAFPLVVVTLGASPRDAFREQWPWLLENVTTRLKVSPNCGLERMRR